MSPEILISNLRSRGFNLSAAGDSIEIFPFSKLTDMDRETIRAYKPEILALLGRRPGEGCFRDHCRGQLSSRGELWICSTCGTWFSHQGPLTEADQYCLDERAAIREYDGNLDRDRAEELAAEEWTASQMVN